MMDKLVMDVVIFIRKKIGYLVGVLFYLRFPFICRERVMFVSINYHYFTNMIQDFVGFSFMSDGGFLHILYIYYRMDKIERKKIVPLGAFSVLGLRS